VPKRVRNLTALFKATFASVTASIGIANEADELILNEAGESITAENETVFAQSRTAGRLGGTKTAITGSTGGYSA